MELFAKPSIMEKVTVLIPLYNKAEYIQECIQSVLNQSYPNLEIIVVDDGSTDGSQDIVRCITDERISFHQNPVNLGTAGNGNKCFDLVKTPYAIRQDADDVMPEGRILSQLEYLTKYKDVAIVTGLNTYKHNKEVQKNFLKQDLVNEIFFTNPVSQPTAAYNMDLLNRHQLRFIADGPNIGEDWIFFYNTLKKSKILNVPEVFNIYRYHQDNISRVTNPRYFDNIRYVINYIFNDNGIKLSENEIKAHFLFRQQVYTDINNVELIKLFNEWQMKLVRINNDSRLIDDSYLKDRIAKTSDFIFFKMAYDRNAIREYRKHWKMNWSKWRYLISLRIKG